MLFIVPRVTMLLASLSLDFVIFQITQEEKRTDKSRKGRIGEEFWSRLLQLRLFSSSLAWTTWVLYQRTLSNTFEAIFFSIYLMVVVRFSCSLRPIQKSQRRRTSSVAQLYKVGHSSSSGCVCVCVCLCVCVCFCDSVFGFDFFICFNIG